MFGTLLRFLMSAVTGIIITRVADYTSTKTVLPLYPSTGLLGTVTAQKVIWFIITLVAGAWLAKFIGRKLNIKLLK